MIYLIWGLTDSEIYISQTCYAVSFNLKTCYNFNKKIGRYDVEYCLAMVFENIQQFTQHYLNQPAIVNLQWENQ